MIKKAATKGKAKSTETTTKANDNGGGFAEALKGKLKVFNEAKKIKVADNSAIIKALKLKPGKAVNVVAKLTKAATGTDKDGNATIRFDYVITRGAAEKMPISSRFTVKDYSEEFTEADVLRNICQTLQKLGYETDDNEEGKFTPQDIEEICEELSKEKPTVTLKVKQKGEYVNCDVVKLADTDEEDSEEEESEEEESEEDDSEEEEESEEEDASEEEESEDEEEEEEEEDSEEEEEESENPEIGNVVTITKDKKKVQYAVKKVNTKAKTVDLVDVKTKKVKKTAKWSEIEFVIDDD